MDLLQCYNESRLKIDWNDAGLWISVASIVFNPTFWNIVARKGQQSTGALPVGPKRQRLHATRYMPTLMMTIHLD